MERLEEEAHEAQIRGHDSHRERQEASETEGDPDDCTRDEEQGQKPERPDVSLSEDSREEGTQEEQQAYVGPSIRASAA